MSLTENIESLRIGYEPIDREHQEFIDLLNQLASSDNQAFLSLFKQLLEHTERHFEHENQLMDRYAFPAATEHKGEHQRVLGEFKQFKKRVDKGLISFGRSFVNERLPQWFTLHVTTMDSALAAHFKLQD